MFSKSTAVIIGASMYLFLTTFVTKAYALQTSGAACPPGQLCNPLKSQSIGEFLTKILDVLLVFAVPVIVFFIMYAGFLFATARGDTGQIEKARTALLWSVVGGVIVLGAKVITGVIQGTVTGL